MNEKKLGELRTTGQLRTMLANAAKAVMQGQLDIERANALHRIAKNITDSLYSETKIAMFQHESGVTSDKLGDMLIGESEE